MVGLIPEGISEIIQNELQKLDLAKKRDLQNLLRDNLASHFMIDKEELSRLISESIGNNQYTLNDIPITRKTDIRETPKPAPVHDEQKVQQKRPNEQQTFHHHSKQKFQHAQRSSFQPTYQPNQNVQQQKISHNNNKPQSHHHTSQQQPQSAPQNGRDAMPVGNNIERKPNFKDYKDFKQKKGKSKKNKKGSFDKHDKFQKYAEAQKPASDSPVAQFIFERKPKDKMQELKLLAFYLDQVDNLEIYNTRDFFRIYKRADIKVPPVFDTLVRFLVKSDFLKVTEAKKDGFICWKITEKVLKEFK
jgi:hypothetical protein